MPILYSNNKNMKDNMKKINEITKQDALDIIFFQPLYSMTSLQAARMIEIVKNFYDPLQASCSSCGSSMRSAKDKIILLYKENKETIDLISQDLYIEEVITSSEVSSEENADIQHVKIFSKKNKKK